MSEANVGGVDYKIHISGDVSAFTKTMDNVEKAFSNLDKSVNQMSQKMDKAFGALQNSAKSLDSAVKTFGKTTTASMNTAAKSSENLSKTNEKLARSAESAAKGQANNSRQSTQMMKMMQAASRQVEKLSTSYSNMGADAGKFITPLNTALTTYQRNLKAANGDTVAIAKSQEIFKNSVHGVQVEMSRYKAELQHTTKLKKDANSQSAEAAKAMKAEQAAMRAQEKIAIKMADSIAQAERETSALVAQMKRMKASDTDILPLTKAMDRYRVSIREAGGDQTKVAAANREYKNSLQKVKNEVTTTGKTLGKFGDQNQMVEQSLHNTTKAIQLALGPLSGIAARVTAFTSLLKTNTVAIASFVSSITALVVATNIVIREGIEYERQMLSMAAAVESSGYAAETTTGQINAMAESIAEATLSSTRETRQAAQLLLNYRNLSVGSFDDILMAAQGMASMMGTNLVAAVRMLGRAMEDPASNLDALRRVNIQFNRSEKEKIKILQNSGRMMEAQNVIMSRFNVAQNLARKETEGLAGAIDTMRERILKIREQTAVYAQTNEKLAEAVVQVNEVFEGLLEDGNRIEPLMDAIAGATRVLASTIKFLTDNINAVVLVIAVGFVGSMVRATVALISWTLQFGKLQIAARAGTGTIGLLTARFAGLATTMKVVGAVAGTLSIAAPILAGAAAGVMLLDSFQKSDMAINKLRKNIQLLDKDSERNTKMQELQQDALLGVGKSANNAAKELSSMAKVDLSKLTSTIEAFSTQNFFKKSILDEAKWFFDEFGKYAAGGVIRVLMNIPDVYNSVVKRLDKIEGGEVIRQQFEEIFTTIKNGGVVAEGAIEELQDAIRESGDEETNVQQLVDRFIELRKIVEDTSQFIDRFNAGVGDMAGVFDVGVLIEGLEKSGLREYITGTTDDVEKLRTAMSAAEIGAADAGATAAAMFENQVEAAVAAYQASNKGVEATSRFEDQMSMLGVASRAAANDLQNLDKVVDGVVNSDFNNFLDEVDQKLRIIGSSDPLSEILKVEDENAIKKLADDAGLLSNDLLQVNERMLAIYNTMSEEQQAAFADIEGFDGRNFLTLATNMKSAKMTAEEFAAVLFEMFKQADRDIEGVLETTKELENAFALAGASGSEAFQNMLDAQELQSDIDDIKESLKEFNLKELEDLAKMYGVTAEGADALRIAIAKEAGAANVAAEENEDLAKVFEKSMENMDELTTSLKDAEAQYKALVKGGIEGLDKALRKQKAAEMVKEMTEEWDKLADAQDRLLLIQELQAQVGNSVKVDADNYTEVLRDQAEKVVALEEATDDYTKSLENLNDGIEEIVKEAELLSAQYEVLGKGLGSGFAEDIIKARELTDEFERTGRKIEEMNRLNSLFPELFNDAENFEEDMVELLGQQRIQKQWLSDWEAATDEFEGIAREGFHSIFTDGISGFKDMVDSFKDMFKKMLLDMIYEASIKPIMVQVSAAVTGMFNPAANGSGTGGDVLGTIGSLTKIASGLEKAYSFVSGGGALASSSIATGGLNAVSGAFQSVGNFVSDIGFEALGDKIWENGANLLADGVAAGLADIAVSMGASIAGGFAGTELGEMLLGKNANSALGATIGGAIGTAILPGVGSFIGSAIGGFADSLFGSSNNKKAGTATNLGTGLKESWGGGANLEPTQKIVDTLSAFADAIGGSSAIFEVGLGNKSGLDLRDNVTGEKTKYDPDEAGIEALMNDAMDIIISKATELPETVKQIALELEGNVFEMYAQIETLNAAYEKAPIDIKAIRELQQYGEELVDTFIRLSTNIAGVNGAFEKINVPLLTMDTAGARVADNLVNLFGGVDALSESMSAYYNTFFSEEERMQDTMSQLTDVFEQIGVALPDTNDEFRKLVESLDLTTESGQKTFAQLMQIAPAFDQIMKKQEELIRAEEDRAQAAIDEQRRVMNEMLSAAGISADAIGTVLRDGLLHRMTAEDVGAKLVETVIGGVYNALASTYANQITTIMMNGIVEPMVNAAATGASVSAAVSQSAIDSMVSQARAAAKALATIMNDPQFKAAIEEVSGSLRTVGRVIAPRAVRVPPTFNVPEFTNSVKKANDIIGELEKTTNASLDALKKYIAEERRLIEDRMSSLEDAAVNFMDGFERNIDEQIRHLDTAHDELMDNLDAAIDPVKDSIKELDRNANSLRKTIDSLKDSMTDPTMARDAAMSTLRGFLGGGITNQDAFDKSLSTIASNDQKYYSSFQDYAIDQLRAQSLLDVLLTETEGQLSTEEQMLNSLEAQMEQAQQNHEDQIALLEAQLQAGQDAIDQMMGVDTALYELSDVLSAVAAYQDYQTEALDRLHELDEILSNAERQLDELRGINVGITDVATAMNAFTNAFAAEAEHRGVNIPAFSSGGSHTGGVRLVGENGPEIESTGASRIFSARQSASELLDTRTLVDKLNEVVEELEQIKEGNVQLVKNSGRSLDYTRRWDNRGLPPTRSS